MQKIFFLFFIIFFNSAYAERYIKVRANEMVIAGGEDIDFGSVQVGQSKAEMFTLINSGKETISFYEIFFDFTKGQLAFLGKDEFPGSGGTCAAFLKPKESCSFVVVFKPSAQGLVKARLRIKYYYGNLLQRLDMMLHGMGVGASPAGVASVAISDGPTYDFGLVTVGAVATHTFTVVNTGTNMATSMTESGLAAPFGFLGGSYPGTGGTCAATLSPASTCTVVVVYSPAVLGVDSDTLDINYFDGVALQSATRDLQGTAGSPASLTISDGPVYNYGTQATGSLTDKTFTLTNSGGTTATGLSDSGSLSAPFLFKGGSYPGTGGTCGASLVAVASCTIVVTFAPTGTGAMNDTIAIDYNNGSQVTTAMRDLTGTGVAPALISISDTDPYDFGSTVLTVGVDHEFTLTNTGAVSATAMSGAGLATPFMFKGGVYPGTGGTCMATLSPAASCTVVVTFVPVAAGSYSDTLDISYFDGAAAQTSSRQVTGAGVSSAFITISDATTYSFGDVKMGDTYVHTFTLTNAGASTATAMSGAGLSSPFQFALGAYPGSGGTCGSSLAAGASCTVRVSFKPTAVGSYSDDLEINYNDGSGPMISFRGITGTGFSK